MKTIAIMRQLDGVCIDIVETDADWPVLDGWKHLRDCLPADRIAQLQNQGIGVDESTEVYAAVT